MCISSKACFFVVFMNSTFFENTGTRLKAWQKTMPRDADRQTFCFLQAWQGKTCENKEQAGQLRGHWHFLRTGSRTPADSRRRPMVVADIPPADMDVREPGLDLHCRGHWRTPGGHLADKAPKRPEVAGAKAPGRPLAGPGRPDVRFWKTVHLPGARQL